MGEVYRARDTKLHRDVALKILRSVLEEDAGRRARFGREAQALASLNHPNIAQIHGLEEDSSGVQVLVLELVEGVPPPNESRITLSASPKLSRSGGKSRRGSTRPTSAASFIAISNHRTSR